MRVGARALAAASLAAIVVFAGGPPAPAAAASGPSPAARAVIAAAERHLGAPWRFGATGPSTFDCSGLVWYAFRSTGHFAVIGNGRYRGADAMLRYFRSRGLASTTNGQPGDLVVYGGGAHIGIYLGGGKVVSTLVNGVHIHGLYALHMRFTTFLHTGLNGPVKASRPTTAARAAALARHAITALNVRAGASTAYRVRTVVARGARLTVLGSILDRSHHRWYRVRTAGGSIGWVAGWLTR